MGPLVPISPEIACFLHSASDGGGKECIRMLLSLSRTAQSVQLSEVEDE